MTADRLQAALWIGFGLALLYLINLLGPVLTPFLLAAILAYVLDPLVDRLSSARVGRTGAVLMLLTTMILLGMLLILTLLPLVRAETRQLMDRLPELLEVANNRWLPWVSDHFGITLSIGWSPEEVRGWLTEHWEGLQSLLGGLAQSAAKGGQALLQLATTLLLTPAALFYLLRDWDTLLARLREFVPPRWQGTTLSIAREVDGVLSEFLRGQLLVMLILAIYYSLALSLAGVDFALPLGLVTGLLIFVPYLGYATGLLLSLLVAVLQFQGIPPLLGVALVFGIGQLLESFLLTPYLVGERIGLHPLAVIFALLAFGQLFGFFGILLALPASAALLVGLRHLRGLYLNSPFYRNQ